MGLHMTVDIYVFSLAPPERHFMFAETMYLFQDLKKHGCGKRYVMTGIFFQLSDLIVGTKIKRTAVQTE
jgi:hypothetical protein